MPFVYIVRCADDTLYTGWTTDLDRRIAQHNAGRGGAYTRQHGPVTLVYREEVADRGAALRREAAIKQYDRPRKERLINSVRPGAMPIAGGYPARSDAREGDLAHEARRNDRPGGDA